VAFVVPSPGEGTPALAELRAFALKALAPAKAPREIVRVDAIPRTPGGKPLRHLLPPPGRDSR